MGVFSVSDYSYAKDRGIDAESLDKQWEMIERGFPRVVLDRPALIGDGINRLSKEDEARFIHLFEIERENYLISKFVPASGAASRMFLPVREMREDPESEKAAFILENIRSFPFFNDLEMKAEEKNVALEKLLKDPKALAEFILDEHGLDYDHYPKGLITFYCDDTEKSSAFEQQVHEAIEICDGNIHFTVAENYLQEISTLLHQDKASFSIQNPSTHFIAKNGSEPLRDEEGNLIFRPSGHGALLKNLNELDADIVFIKNIDNIQIAKKNEASIRSKKILGGFLIYIKQQIDTFLFQLEEEKDLDLGEMIAWIQKWIEPGINNLSKEEIQHYLHRPIRIAGMVLNEGKAGGGPFWVKKDTQVRLQIVEAAQINKEADDQRRILENSTHFNPVDMVCSLIDHKGEAFDLQNFIDKESGFLSPKIIAGKEVTIMERPGLWNGSMANWISIFIELPLASFTPVKTVMDLLNN
jgi:hypothetical protein